MKKALLALLALGVTTFSEPYDLTYLPPAELKTEETPMFVCFGWDDNAYADAVTWIDEFTAPLKNSDGSKVRHTFFLTSAYASGQKPANQQKPEEVLKSWRSLYARGHEIGNHTELHEQNKATADSSYWYGAINRCNKFLLDSIVGKNGKIEGFRTPYLGYSAPTFKAIKANGFRYDCSIEKGYEWFKIKDGFQGPNGWVPDVAFSPGDAKGGKLYWWPYDLKIGAAAGSSPIPGSVLPKATDGLAGLLEVPVCRYQYSENENLTDAQLLQIDDAMKVSGVTGFDFNMFKKLCNQAANKEKMLQVFKFNFQQRMQGNRCPITINVHTDYYSDFNLTVNDPSSQDVIKDPVKDRRWIIEEFTKYVLQFPAVRIVPYTTMLDWMKNPKKTTEYVAPDLKPSVGVVQKTSATKNFSGICTRVNGTMLVIENESAKMVQGKIMAVNGRQVGVDISIPTRGLILDIKGVGLSSGVYILSVNGAANTLSRFVVK